MKTNQIPKLFATAIAAFAFVGIIANAQYNAGDGIAASPKLRQALNERAASVSIATSKVSAMACPKCKDITVTEVNRQAKAAETMTGAANKLVNKHTCAACETTSAVVGTGKAKQTVATHTCTAAVAKNLTCCAAAMAK